MSGSAPRALPKFNVKAFLGLPGLGRRVREYRRGETVFQQGDACDDVHYVQRGGVQLSVRSNTGRVALVGVMGPGDFFGEACLAEECIRTGTATAITPSDIVRVDKFRMAQLLHARGAMSERFILHMLSRHERIEEDLVEQMLTRGDTSYQRGSL